MNGNRFNALNKLKQSFKQEELDITEDKVTEKVKRYLDKLEGVWYFKVHVGMGMQRAGIPDLILCIYGKFVAIELKRVSGKPTSNQALCIHEIKQKGGGVAIVTYGYDDFVKQFKEIYKNILLRR